MRIVIKMNRKNPVLFIVMTIIVIQYTNRIFPNIKYIRDIDLNTIAME